MKYTIERVAAKNTLGMEIDLWLLREDQVEVADIRGAERAEKICGILNGAEPSIRKEPNVE